jgi:hypothetical protein
VLGHQSGDAVAPNLALPFEPLALRKAAAGLTAGGCFCFSQAARSGSPLISAIPVIADALVRVGEVGTEAEIIPMISRHAQPVATTVPSLHH